MSGLIFLVCPAISFAYSLEASVENSPSRENSQSVDGEMAESIQSRVWTGLPYFNGDLSGQTVFSLGNRTREDQAAPALKSSQVRVNGETSGYSEHKDMVDDTDWSEVVPVSSTGLTGVSGNQKSGMPKLVGFRSPSEGQPSPIWRYQKLFAASSADTQPESELETPYEELSLILTPAVERNIRYFQTVIPDRFQEWLTRFYRYKPSVEQIFEELGIPQELVYLSLVESGFNPRAYSRARAAGPWQFMKATGRIYGLRVNWYIDERRDPVKSSVAAAQHLRDLYDRFGSWPLALAAYNAGSGKISRAIKKAGTRDFWKIAKTRYIRRETREYVPKFMAATIIASNPSLFGFHADVPDLHDYEEVVIYNTVHLRAISKETGIEFDTLRHLNPELRRSITPPDKEGYFLKVPVGSGAQVAGIREQIAQWKEPPVQVTTYRVRRGDSLSVIAKRFRMTIQKLKDLNNLSGHMIHIGQKLRVSSVDTPDSSNPEDVRWYRVRKGDSLWSIAKRYSVSIGELKILNNLRSSFIRVGHLLKISN